MDGTATTQTPVTPLWHPTRTPALRRTAHRREPGGGGDPPARRHCHLHGGDWEGDTIVGKGLCRVTTLVERNSGLLRMRRVANGEATSTMRAILHALYPFGSRVHTLTWDNGSEFAEHALIDIALDAKSYFADPYSSWQRGTNENMTIPFLGPMVCCGSTCPNVAASATSPMHRFSTSKTSSIDVPENGIATFMVVRIPHTPICVRPILQTRCTSKFNSPEVNSCAA